MKIVMLQEYLWDCLDRCRKAVGKNMEEQGMNEHVENLENRAIEG